jgi:hypothetical protein
MRRIRPASLAIEKTSTNLIATKRHQRIVHTLEEQLDDADNRGQQLKASLHRNRRETHYQDVTILSLQRELRDARAQLNEQQRVIDLQRAQFVAALAGVAAAADDDDGDGGGGNGGESEATRALRHALTTERAAREKVNARLRSLTAALAAAELKLTRVGMFCVRVCLYICVCCVCVFVLYCVCSVYVFVYRCV